jgi:TonB family protein
MIFINDPVAGVNFALDIRLRIAHKMPPMRFEFKTRFPEAMGGGIGAATGGSVGAGVRTAGPAGPSPAPEMSAGAVFERMAPPPEAGVRISGPPPGAPGEGAMVFERTPMSPDAGGMVFRWQGGRDDNAKNEALGKQLIEGVEAEGTRSTIEIAAGEIGNERPIEIVFERWYSPELQVVVMTKHSDPRFGETTYRLTNINRAEPAHELFEVPADYKVQDFSRTPMAAPMDGISGGALNGKAIMLPPPEYPAIARAAKAFGSVTVQVTIDEGGNVVSARSVSGHPLLQAAAVAAAKQAKFAPTKLSGQPVKVNGVLVYTFVAQ